MFDTALGRALILLIQRYPSGCEAEERTDSISLAANTGEECGAPSGDPAGLFYGHRISRVFDELYADIVAVSRKTK